MHIYLLAHARRRFAICEKRTAPEYSGAVYFIVLIRFLLTFPNTNYFSYPDLYA